MKLRHVMLAMVAMGALAACATLEPAPQFVQQLNKQYKNLSVGESESKYDWTDAKYFSTKGDRALAGKDVQPEDPVTWGVQPDYLPELNNAYDILQIALVVDEKKVTKPIPAADAQAAFDCWVEQSQEKFTKTDARSQCRAAFYEAVCRMYKNGSCPVVDDIHRVLFATGSAKIDAEGYKAVHTAIAAYGKNKSEVVVAGHADRVGSADLNLALSKSRAEAVIAALKAGGIPASKITEKYFGEAQPLIPTADDVPNINNRRVLIVVR